MFTKILNAEITWVEENKGIAPEEFRKGFVAGLNQAIYLIEAAIQRIELSDGEVLDDNDLLDKVTG